MSLPREKPPTTRDAGRLSLVLNKHPSVLDAVVVSRFDAQGTERAVAYIVPQDIFNIENFRAELEQNSSRQPLPDDYVLVSSIPVNDQGDVDIDRLEQLEVIDQGLIAQWNNALGGICGAAKHTVLAVENNPQIKHTHRIDLLGGLPHCRQMATPSFSNSDSAAAVSEQNTDNVSPAILEAETLIAPEDQPQTLVQVLQRAAGQFGNKGITYVHSDGSEAFQSYQELYRQAGEICSGLSEQGVRPGDRVMLQLADNREFITAFWGCVLGGVVPVPVTIAAQYSRSSATVQKLVNVWRTMGRPGLITSDELVPQLSSVCAELDAADLNILPYSNLKTNSSTVVKEPRTDDLALLLLTSGSTGTPKAVMHTHETLISHAVSSIAFNGFTENEVSLNWMPLDHVGSISMFHILVMYAGGDQVHINTRWVLDEPLRWMEIIDRYKATMTWAPNFAYALVAERIEEIARQQWDLSSMRFMVNAGEAIVVKTAKRFLHLLGAHQLPADCMKPAFGMSETASGLTFSHSFAPLSKTMDETSVLLGAPILNISVRIVDEHNNIVKQGVKGRLQTTGRSVMPGYYKNDEANKSAFTEDGWFDTGDIGFIRDGELAVTARTKDDIVINGVNYLASEIEAVTESIDNVMVSYTAACAVRSETGETDELAIFFCPESTEEKQLKKTLLSIRETISADAGVRPAFIVPLEKNQIPKTAIGKIQRSQIKKQFESGEFDQVLKYADRLLDANMVPEWFFRKVWRQKYTHPCLPLNSLGPAIVFVDDGGAGGQLCSALNDSNVAFVAVEAGDGYERVTENHYRIDPKSEQDYHRFLTELRDRGFSPENIIHFWTCDNQHADVSDLKQLEYDQYLGVYSLVFLVRALSNINTEPERCSLYVFSRGAQITSQADKGDCRHAAVIGLLKTIQLEQDWIKCRHIDLELAPAVTDIDHVINEICLPAQDDEVAYRRDSRNVWGLTPVEFRGDAGSQLPLKTGGIYLVTGGLGGIGAYLAQFLIKNFRARLILVGTTDLPQRQDWRDCLEQGGKLAERLRNYLEIDSLGGEFIYRAADVSDLAGLQNIVAEAEQRWNAKLAGVLHLAAAGDVASYWQDIESHYVSNEPVESFEKMFHAKVYGTWALYQLIEPYPEAVFISFSSASGLFSAAGFSAYSAAHTFIDNYSLYQSHHKHRRSYCFNWSVWEQIGRSKEDPVFARDLYRAMGYFMIPKEQGIDSMMAGLAHNEHYLIAGLDAARWHIAKHLVSETRPLNRLAAFCERSDDAPAADSDLDNLTITDRYGVKSRCELKIINEMPVTSEGVIDYKTLLAVMSGSRDGEEIVQPQTDMEKKIAEIWRDVLKLGSFSVHDSLFQLGGNSLTATQVLSRIAHAFEVDLGMHDLFENATVYKLGLLLEQRCRHAGDAVDYQDFASMDPETLLAHADLLSDAQVAELLERIQSEGELL